MLEGQGHRAAECIRYLKVKRKIGPSAPGKLLGFCPREAQTPNDLVRLNRAIFECRLSVEIPLRPEPKSLKAWHTQHLPSRMLSTMADPPSYEESASAYEYQQHLSDSKSDSKAPQRFSIREEVGLSRSQHVAVLVSRLLPQIRERARQGLSKSTLLLIPSNQGMSSNTSNIRRIADDSRCRPQRPTSRLSVRRHTHPNPARRASRYARVLDASASDRRAQNAATDGDVRFNAHNRRAITRKICSGTGCEVFFLGS